MVEAAELEESFRLVSISLRSGGISRLVRFQSAKVIIFVIRREEKRREEKRREEKRREEVVDESKEM